MNRKLENDHAEKESLYEEKINFKKINPQKTRCHIYSVLVGGGCVSIHSRNRYESYDLD